MFNGVYLPLFKAIHLSRTAQKHLNLFKAFLWIMFINVNLPFESLSVNISSDKIYTPILLMWSQLVWYIFNISRMMTMFKVIFHYKNYKYFQKLILTRKLLNIVNLQYYCCREDVSTPNQNLGLYLFSSSNCSFQGHA